MSNTPRRASCTSSDHDALRADPVSFAEGTVAIGTMDDCGTTLQLANCRRCNSTLAIELPAAGAEVAA